jgi:DNA-binding NtrC family response regulator
MLRPTLLCVDDDAGVLELYRVLFTSHGYEVVVAKNGFEALEVLHSQKVSAVVLDQEMPGLRGSEAAAEIKRRTPDLPVVMVSGCESVVKAVPRFVDAAVEKGASITCLLEKVDKLLRAARATGRGTLFTKRAFLPLGSALAAVAMAGAVISRAWK